MASEKFASSGKFLLDYAGGFLLLLLFLPLIVILGITITIRYGCSPVYTQRRIGKNGTPFRIIKLRTIDSDNIPTKGWLAKFLRKTNMDELPQLLNVLMGNMSLVGPRPHLPEHVARYEDWQRERLTVKPGITGLRQISQTGKLEFNELLEQDLLYIQKMNLAMDIKILVKTANLQLRKIGDALKNNTAL